jgi:hypothetical protein
LFGQCVVSFFSICGFWLPLLVSSNFSSYKKIQLYILGAIFDQSSQHLASIFEYEVTKLSNKDNDIILEEEHAIVDCQDSFEVSNASKYTTMNTIFIL